MSKIAEIEKDLSKMRAALKTTKDPKMIQVLGSNIKKAEHQLEQEKEKEKKPAPAPKKAKKSKPAKKAKAAKKVVKHEEKPDCHELAAAWEKRRKAAKASAGKKTTPIMKRAADSMEKIVRAGIQYNKQKGGDLNVDKLKEAVKSMTDALDIFKEALNGKFEDTYIDNFKKDMMKILKAVEE